MALEKIILIEVAKTLNDTVRGFYVDAEALKTAMFSDNPPTRKTVLDTLRDLLSDADEKDMKASFEKAKYYIIKNIADNQLTTQKIAEYAGVSERVLVTLFKENAEKVLEDYMKDKHFAFYCLYRNGKQMNSKWVRKLFPHSFKHAPQKGLGYTVTLKGEVR